MLWSCERGGRDKRIINSVICGALKSTWSHILFGSAGALGPPCQLRISPIDPFQHIGHLSRRDRHRTVRRRRPDEPPAVQTFGVKRQSDPIMPQDLGQIAATTAEYEEIAAVGIALETLLNLQGQPLHAPSHVGVARRDPDPTARWNRDHRRSRTCSTRARAAASTLVSTMTRRSLPTTITIRPRASAASIVGAVSAAATTIAGTKPACCAPWRPFSVYSCVGLG